VRRLAPNVVLMDVRMPDMDGIAATREIVRAAPDARVLMLTTFSDDDYILGALRAGASGFLLKRTRPEALIAAIHAIAAGESWSRSWASRADLLSAAAASSTMQIIAAKKAPKSCQATLRVSCTGAINARSGTANTIRQSVVRAVADV
jgi:DNA-binding NarL/FixJ family response regulator